MRKRTVAVLVAVLTFALGVAIAKLSLPLKSHISPVPERQFVPLNNYRLTGPFEHDNLSIYLIHAPDAPQTNTDFMPLAEAMERKLVIVHETNDVNELAIENLSLSQEVLVQAGDIVKGGQQDRVLAVDLILPSRSRPIPIAAFCVEQGRWRQRGSEQVDQFTITEMVATKGLKIATRRDADQQKVWDRVSVAQEGLSAGVAQDVRSRVSEPSLPLALEHEKVQEAAAAYVSTLSAVVHESSDAIGFAFSINNILNSAEVYASNKLFKRFWPRLLKAAAIEAVSQKTTLEEKAVVSMSMVTRFLADGESGSESLREVDSRTHMLKREGKLSLFFETRDMAQRGDWIHRSYLNDSDW